MAHSQLLRRVSALALRVASLHTGSMPEAQKHRRVEVAIPEEAFARQPHDLQRIAEEMALYWILELVRQRRLGFGKAAELAEIPVARFLEIMHERHITPFDYDDDELDREFA